MTDISKDAILKSDDLPTEDVDIPEWGGSLTVRTMTGSERDEFESAIQRAGGARGKIDLRGLKARLVQLTVLNGDGALLFDAKDLPALQKKSARAIDRIFQVAQRLNGLTAGDVEEMVGNSPGSRSGGSGSS